MSLVDLSRYVRDVADFPQPGIVFKDLTPLWRDAAAFAECIVRLAAPLRELSPTVVCGIEARGFVFGAALAQILGVGFVPIRKPGKLPGAVVGVDYGLEYGLEYGRDRLEILRGALHSGDRVALVDDVLATGGTLLAARQLVLGFDLELVAATVVIELDFLDARSRWPVAVPLHSLLHY